MSTQVLQLEVGSTPSVLRVRDDVAAVLIVLTSHGRPVELLRMRRPADGILKLEGMLERTDVVSGSRSVSEKCEHAPSRPAPPAKNGPNSQDVPREARLLGAREALLSRAPSRTVDAHDGFGQPSAPEHAGSQSVPLSVVIPTHERPDDLARCLESLAGIQRAGHEVIVVDNAPVTGRTAQVGRQFGVRYLVEPTPGANRARNAGWAAASHDVVAFVDDDVVVSPAWISAIGRSFADSTVGCATGLVLPLELETAAQETFELYCRHRRDLRSRVYSRAVLPASAAGVVGMGANMAFRRAVLVALGGFDSRFGPGTRTRTGDETDMFARTLDAGWAIAYSPDAYVWHRHRRTPAEVRSCVFGYGVGLYSMLTKRLVEQRDFGALVTGGRWLLGPILKAARAKIARAPSPPWTVVLAETAGAPFGPLWFGYETWRGRSSARSVSEKCEHAPSRSAPPTKNGRNLQVVPREAQLLGAREALLRQAPRARAR